MDVRPYGGHTGYAGIFCMAINRSER